MRSDQSNGGGVVEPPRPPARFIEGSILRHLLVMTGTSAVGLMAIFVGDLANIFFLSLLKEVELVAAVGYASSILFVATAIGIGLAIAATALVAPAIGARDMARARRLATHCHIATAMVSAVLAMALWFMVPQLLSWLGAGGRTHALATDYLRIIMPALPPLASGMTSAAVLRSVGDAQRGMYVTLVGAIVNIVLDPIFIFALGLGLHGAALASVLSRLVIMAVGLNGVARIHRLLTRPDVPALRQDARAIADVALPAIAANVANPVSNAYVTFAIAPFGDDAVAGWAVIGRIFPFAFGAIYALSGSVGPILGQNLGAGRIDRVRSSLTEALRITLWFTAAAWALLIAAAPLIVNAFHASGAAAQMIKFYCYWCSPLFVFLGALFVANACFNTLGKAKLSTWFNWGRATLGTLPFVMLGSHLAGTSGVLMGNMLGGVPFGIAAVWMCLRLIDARAADTSVVSR